MPQSHSWMTILLVIETGGGGSGRHIIDLIKILSERGHHIHLLYSTKRADPWFSGALKTLATLKNVEIQEVPMRQAPHLDDFLAIQQIRSYIKQHGPFDVIHGHSSKGGALARIAALGCPGVSLYTPHAFRTMDIALTPLPKLFYSSIERLLGFIGDGVILVSSEEKTHALQQCKLQSDKLFIVENGLSPTPLQDRHTLRDSWGVTDEICIGFVGRLVPQKNPQLLIEGFARANSKTTHAKLVILGDGPLKPELQALAHTLGVEQRIIWLTGDNGSTLMSGFDIFALSSLYEAFPYVLLEATAAGLPIISTPVGGADALVQDGINGIQVTHKQASELAQAIDTLILSSDLRQSMGEQSKQISDNHSIEKMADRTERVYRQLRADK